MNNQKVFYWQSVWEKIYGKAQIPANYTLNTAGWISSYTNLLIPDIEILECLTNTSLRICALKPKNILEIGCGTGMILFRVAPYCESYWGTDISKKAIDYVESVLPQSGLANVKITNQPADDFAFEGEFDTVILNSVIQYFPDTEYLSNVIKRSLGLIKKEGCIFIGDIRSRSMLGLFNAAIEFHWASDEMLIKELWQRIQTYIAKEEELILDPRFFLDLKTQFQELTYVEIQLKRGVHRNEVILYRYDVILHVGKFIMDDLESLFIEWGDRKMSLVDLQNLLIESRPKKIFISHVPNARLAQEILLWDYFLNPKELQTVKELRDYLQNIPKTTSVQPEDVWNLGEQLNYRVELFWSLDGTPGYFDILMTS